MAAFHGDIQKAHQTTLKLLYDPTMIQPYMNSVYSIRSVKLDDVQSNNPVNYVDKIFQFCLASYQYSPLLGLLIAFFICLFIRHEAYSECSLLPC